MVRAFACEPHTCRYMEAICLAAMLAAKRLAGVTPKVNLREHVNVYASTKHKFWLSNPEISSEIQKSGISALPPQKRTYVL